MNRNSPSAPQRKQDAHAELVIQEAFDYTPLTTELAEQAQSAALRIRQMVQRTMQDVLCIGQELLAIKEALSHGHFGPWLRAEFGWTERTARRFMAVAERFGPKTDIVSDLRIDPTAAYLLTAASAPEEAIAVAVERAQRGERITVSLARGILDKLRKKPRRPARREPALPAAKLLGQLLEVLESFRQRWEPRQVALLARQLHDFADSLEKRKSP